LGEAHHVEDPATKREKIRKCTAKSIFAILKVGFPKTSHKSPRVMN
jgi:hypothetical protein